VKNAEQPPRKKEIFYHRDAKKWFFLPSFLPSFLPFFFFFRQINASDDCL